MGNVESCCAYGASPRPDRTPKLKPGGAYRGSNNRSNGHYAHQQVKLKFNPEKLVILRKKSGLAEMNVDNRLKVITE